jgi:iron complex outermembrane receptor protein
MALDLTTMLPHRKLPALFVAAIAAVLRVSAQEAASRPVTPLAAADSAEQTVELPSFTVSTIRDDNYVGKAALSSTRIAVDIVDLPQSVKVLNNSFLKAVNPFNLADVLNYTGGAQNGALNWTPGRNAIRGFAGDGDYNDSFAPTAGSVVDNILYERFEIIKGPSTIFLAADGSPGGVINKITKDPLPTQQTILSVQAGLYDGNRVSLDTTGPVTKDAKLLYRVVSAFQYSNGYYDSTYMHRMTLMPELSYQFTPDTKVVIKSLLVETNWPSYNGLMLDPRTLQIWNVPYTRSASESAPYNWRHDAVKRVWMSFTSRLNDYVALRIAAMDAYDRADRLESLANTWNEGGRTWNAATTPTSYVGGPYPRTTTADDAVNHYLDLQTDLNFNFKTGPVNHSLLVGSEIRSNPGGTKSYAGTSSPWDPFNVTTPTVTVNYSAPSAFNQNTSTFGRAYFLETAKFFSDRLLLSYGLTRTVASQSTLNQLTNVYSLPSFTVYKNLRQWGAVVKVTKNVNLFTGYNENYALNGVGIVNGVSGPLPPKQGQQWEAGLKGTFLNKKLTTNISYFDIKQQNNTVPSSPLDPANPNILIPGVISRGFDADVSYQVSNNFYVMGSAADFKAKSILGPAAATFIQPGTGTIIANFIPVDNIAQHTWSLFGLYKFTDGSLKGLNVGLGANYLCHRAITDNANQVFFGYEPGRTLVNANLSYRYNSHLSYGLNIDNLLDTKYIYSIRSENVIVPGPSINAKFSVEYRF